ncbi:unnamed protein product [Caenorhabditis bovis]|uniref:Uncharacterized protein n=1 Tax=Caenorhabditis bovis TaxID=2654633 RepID=A0A8S1FFL9_9PELO|nr:unnamed protein product [Caenorhabditis bovis]
MLASYKMGPMPTRPYRVQQCVSSSSLLFSSPSSSHRLKNRMPTEMPIDKIGCLRKCCAVSCRRSATSANCSSDKFPH